MDTPLTAAVRGYIAQLAAPCVVSTSHVELERIRKVHGAAEVEAELARQSVDLWAAQKRAENAFRAAFYERHGLPAPAPL